MNEEQTADEQSPDDLLLTGVFFYFIMTIAALVAGWLLGPDPRALVPKLAAENWIPLAKGLGYGTLAAVPMLALVEVIRWIPCEPVRKLERLSEDGAIHTLLQLRAGEMVVLSLCAGIGEELFFRGWLMYWIAEISEVGGAGEGGHSAIALIAGLIVSSIAFGLVHPLTKLYIVIAAVIGFYLGGLLIWTENLLIPIVAHGVYDAAQMIWTKYGESKKAEA